MKIQVISIVTSDDVRRMIEKVVAETKRPETIATVVSPKKGPPTVDSSYDEAFAVPPMLELVKVANASAYDAIVLACFCDAGVDAAREISDIPVIAMEEATLAFALTLGSRFGIITEKVERVAMKEVHVRRAGLSDRLASIEPLGLSVAELTSKPEEAKRRAAALAKKMVKAGAEVLIMGCAVMAGYQEHVAESVGVPVLDPTAVALKMAELTVDLRVMHSKAGLYHCPEPKPIEWYQDDGA